MVTTAKPVFMATAMALTVTACGGSSGTEPVTDAAAFADPLAMARAAYAVTANRPADFYRESDPFPDRLTLTGHVRSTDIDPAAAVDYELCSDDAAEAQRWADIDAAQYSSAAALTGSSAADWYFEFAHDLGAVPPAMFRARVYRCTALDRSVAAGDVLGQINRQPLSAAGLKFAVEYLWTYSAQNSALNAVWSSASAPTGAELGHELVLITIRKFQGEGGCDRLDVSRERYAVTADGLLRASTAMLQSFDARLVGGDAELCE
ncbi:MAG: hypothetical protein AAFZ58_05875 [Pseudomonadota bacterium]